MRSVKLAICFIAVACIFLEPLSALAARTSIVPAHLAKKRKAEAAQKPVPKPNLFAQFFMSPDLRLEHETQEMMGFAFVETPNLKTNTRYSIVTDFGGNVLKTQAVPGLLTFQDIRKWLKEDLEVADFEGVEIKKLSLYKNEDGEKVLYWVGHKAYNSLEKAQSEIALVKAVVDAQGGDFDEMVLKVQSAFYTTPEEKNVVEIKSVAQQRKEEEVVLKYLDKLDIGEKLYGPFHGEPTGEPLLWQSFGETTWRQRNFESKNFGEQVGFWTNRVVFKGINAPLATLDPFIEATTSMESSGVDFKSNLVLTAGVEWRPFERNAFANNFRAWGIPLFQFLKNYRAVVSYSNRKNIKDEIEGSDNHELYSGVTIFYEFGIDLPPIDQRGKPKNTVEFLEKYMWGEYFGNYGFYMTGFSAEDDFDAWVANSSILLGFKTPAIPLPANPLTDELILMPYAKFEHVNNDEFEFGFTNRMFVGAGLRWMPFNNYRFKENEWLAKTKLFVEFDGIGKVQTFKSREPANDIRRDLRFGINISSKRF